MPEAKTPVNNTYKVTVQSPLLRPGIVIETEVSERYVEGTVEKMMDIVRSINGTTSE